MDLLEALGPLLAALPRPRLVALVGGGGKTSALFRLAEAASARGWAVLASTTTKMRDPRREGRALDRLLVLPELGAGSDRLDAMRGILPGRAGLGATSRGELLVLGSGLDGEGKLLGLGPEAFSQVDPAWDLVLVEADGSRGLPIKAPAAHEPVLPAGSGILVGLVGLDALGLPCVEGRVHRPELLGPLCGLEAGEPIGEESILRLAASPEGLFKSRPAGISRVILLNKAELLSPGRLRSLGSALAGIAELVLCASLGIEAGGVRVLAGAGAVAAQATREGIACGREGGPC